MSEKLDLEELDAVSGGADRDWKEDGCAASCEWTSWCCSDDLCSVFDVTHDNFWACCPNHEPHPFNDRKCVKAGITKEVIRFNSYPKKPLARLCHGFFHRLIQKDGPRSHQKRYL